MVAEATVEALDGAVLHRLARIDEEQLDAVVVRPALKVAAGELKTVVDDDGIRITGDVVEHLDHTAAG